MAHAELQKKGATLALAMSIDGRLSLTLDLPDGYNAFADGCNLEAEAGWPMEAGSFDAFKGYYMVALPQTGVTGPVASPLGSGGLAVTMTSASAVKKGTVRFAGFLPDGSSVSGSAAIGNIVRKGGDRVALVPVFARTARNVIGVALEIGCDGAA